MKRVFYVVLIMFITFSLVSERNNHAVVITGSTPELAKGSGEFPMLFDGQFLRDKFGEGKYTNDPYNSFWNDTYLTWELLWYYQKFSLFEYYGISGYKEIDHIFVLYGDGVDSDPPWERYTGAWHHDHGWEWPYDITDYSANHYDLNTVVHNLTEGYNVGGHQIDPMGEDDHLFCWTFDHGTSAWITHSVDISNIEDPQPLDYSFVADMGDGIDVQGDYAYTIGFYRHEVNYKGLLTVTDITDPTNLQERGILELGRNRPRAIDVAGDYAYIVTYRFSSDCEGFLVVDISDPDHPEIVGEVIGYGRFEDVEVKDTLAFAIDAEVSNQLYMINIKDPNNPQVLNSMHLPKYWDLSIEGDSVYVVSRLHWVLSVVDISSWQEETIQFSRPPTSVETDENYIYITGKKEPGPGFLMILERDNLNEISHLYILGCDGTDVSLKDNHLYIAGYGGGVFIVDVSDPYNPELISTYRPDSSYITEAVRKDDCLYVSGFGPEGTKSYLCLMDYPISDAVFADKFETIQAGKKVYWMQQCYSGGFIDDLEDTHTVVTTACDALELAWCAEDIPWHNIDNWQSDPNPPLNWENYVIEGSENEIVGDVTYYHGEFNYHIMNVVRRETPTGATNLGPSGYDDYLISMSEAYDYVNSWDSRKYPIMDSLGNTLPPEHPQYSDAGNIGDGTFLGWDDGDAPLSPTGLDYSVSPYPPNPNFVVVNLTWNDNTEEDLVAYSVYHKVPGGNWGFLCNRQSTSYSHKVGVGTIHYYYITAYDMMKQESEPSDILTVFAIPPDPGRLSFGGNEESADNTIYRGGYINSTSFEYPEKKADYGDSLVYEMNVGEHSYLVYVYYSPLEVPQNLYVNGSAIPPVNHKDGLLKYSIYRLTGINGDAIIKIKGVNGDAYMSFLAITDKYIKDTKGESEKGTLNEGEYGIRLLNSVVGNELCIAGLKERDEKVQIGIYDIQGRNVIDRNTEVPESGVLRLKHNLPNGVYILKIKSNKEIYTAKFTVIR
ncbi:T9SS type A sorting domain-containing protein [candidate division WOR-3 bacterium]|nr:T9SS type A sorting domain-containing protein [candidate division WOR-3 bacterium]